MTDTSIHATRTSTLVIIGAVSGAFLTGLSLITPAAPVLVVGAAVVAIALVAAIDHPEIGLVLLVGAATLDHLGRLAEIGPLRLTIYQALVAYMLVVLGARVLKGRSRLSATPIDLPVALFLAIVVSSLFVARDVPVGVVSAISLISSAVVAYMVLVSADTPRRLSVVVLGTAAIGGVIGVFGIVERAEIYTLVGYVRAWGEGVRSTVTFADPNIMGSFQLTAAALALPLVLTLKEWRAKAAGLGLVLATVAGLLTTGSRGGIVGFAVALAVILVFSRIRFSTKVAMALAVIMIGTVWFAFLADPVWLERRVLNVTDDTSMLARVYMGTSALEMAGDYPRGVGIGNYPVHYPFYRDISVRFNLIESHTAYLTVLVETGIFGLLAFLGVLVAAFVAAAKAAWRARDVEVHALAVGAMAAMSGLAAQAFTYSLENSKFWWLSIGVGLACWAIVRRSEEDGATSRDMNGAIEA